MEKITNLTPMYPLITFILPLIICMVLLTWEMFFFLEFYIEISFHYHIQAVACSMQNISLRIISAHQ